jgi:hypothetical protein
LRDLLGILGFLQQYASGVATQVKFRVLAFRVKIQGLTNWSCLAMTLLKALGTIYRVKT